MPDPLPLIVQGLGTIGLKILAAALRDPAFAVVAAVDVAPALVGKPLAQLLPGTPADLLVQPSLAAARKRAPDAHLLLHATGSYLQAVAPQLEAAIAAGFHVVSTCEELAFPFARHPDLSRRLDALARAADRTLVATGVNPGFVMDRLPVLLAAAAHQIRSVAVTRVQDPRKRRLQFQQKVGVDLSRAAYDDLLASGKFGHVGLEESARLIAAGLGWEIVDWHAHIEPVHPDPRGPVLGTLQTLVGRTADGRSIRLHFEANAHRALDYDLIEIDGAPPLNLRLDGGVAGDDATAATVLQAARVLPSAPRGLITVLDLPLRPLPHPHVDPAPPDRI